MSLGMAVVSGRDWRRRNTPFVNQLILAVNGGPASPRSDGWVTYALRNGPKVRRLIPGKGVVISNPLRNAAQALYENKLRNRK